jgi:hypothetical protein
VLPRGSVKPAMRSRSSSGDGFETPYPGVSSMTSEAGVLRVTIPALYPWSSLAFLIFWLIGWTAAGGAFFLVLIAMLIRPDGVGLGTFFLGAWCALWVFAEVMAIKALFWGLFGKEHIIVGLTALEHRKTCLGMSRSKSYRLSSIARFRTAPAVSNKVRVGRRRRAVVPDSSSISFDYGSQSVIMASGMDDAEATRIVEEIQRFNTLLRPREKDRALP